MYLSSYLFRNINFLIIINVVDDIIPDSNGDTTQEITIPDTPPIKGKLSNDLYQITQFGPLIAIVILIIPPIQECVVDTGISK